MTEIDDERSEQPVGGREEMQESQKGRERAAAIPGTISIPLN